MRRFGCTGNGGTPARARGPIRAESWSVGVEFPGAGFAFGEIATLPPEWVARVRRVGRPDWDSEEVIDPVIGRRFLVLPPGEYEARDPKSDSGRRVEVREGERTVVRLEGKAGIRLTVLAPAEAAAAKALIVLELRGTTPGASHQTPYSFWDISESSAAIPLDELAPGGYEIRSVACQVARAAWAAASRATGTRNGEQET